MCPACGAQVLTMRMRQYETLTSAGQGGFWKYYIENDFAGGEITARAGLTH